MFCTILNTKTYAKILKPLYLQNPYNIQYNPAENPLKEPYPTSKSPLNPKPFSTTTWALRQDCLRRSGSDGEEDDGRRSVDDPCRTGIEY